MKDKKRRKKSIRAKLLVFFLLVALSSSIILSITNYILAKNAVVNTANNMLVELGQQTSERMNGKLENISDNIKSLANSGRLIDVTNEERNEVLKKYSEENEYFSMGVADLGGNIIYTNGEEDNLLNKIFYERSLQGSAAIGDPYFSMLEGDVFVVPFSAPIEKDGEIVAILVGLMRSNKISDFISTIKIGENGIAYVISDLGDVIVHPDKTLVDQKENIIKKAEEDQS